VKAPPDQHKVVLHHAGELSIALAIGEHSPADGSRTITCDPSARAALWRGRRLG
jgi:hypothetical protein